MKKPQDTPSRHADKYIVRFPEGMRDQISKAAEESGRSINAEIVARLTESFAGANSPELVAKVARLSVALAMTNTQRLSEQTQSMILQRWVRLFGESLLPLVQDSDPDLANEIKFALKETAALFHSPQKLQRQLAEQAATLRDTLEHFRRLGGVEDEDPALAAMFAEAIGEDRHKVEPMADAKPAKRRVVRKVTR
jgi:hypothetical protein